MFKQRLLTALVLIPLVLGSLYYAPPWMLAGILLVLVVALGWEWNKLIPFEQLGHQLAFIAVLLTVIGCCRYWSGPWLQIDLAIWACVLFAVIGYPASQRYWGYPVVVAGVGLLFLSMFCNVLVDLYYAEHGQNLILYVLFLVWATDTGAYLVGKRFGRLKLIPRVSPGKTVEGSIGGIFLALLVAVIGYFIFAPTSTAMWFLVALLTVLIAMLGDLLISMLKRRSHLKDSGHILPGHGGILDRLDSSLAALPLFYYALSFLEFGR